MFGVLSFSPWIARDTIYKYRIMYFSAMAKLIHAAHAGLPSTHRFAKLALRFVPQELLDSTIENMFRNDDYCAIQAIPM